jgi:hypothetical protein
MQPSDIIKLIKLPRTSGLLRELLYSLQRAEPGKVNGKREHNVVYLSVSVSLTSFKKILECILRKWFEKVWTGFIWLRIGTSGKSCCEHGNEPSGSIKERMERGGHILTS